MTLMKSWFSNYFRKERHRGKIAAVAGEKSGCIALCPVCEKPLTQWERDHNNKPDFYCNNKLVKDFKDKPDRIYIFMRIETSLSSSWKGCQNVPLIICTLCYMDALEDAVKINREQAKGDRIREAYDMELDSEIFTDAWGITEHDFNGVAKCRGDK